MFILVLSLQWLVLHANAGEEIDYDTNLVVNLTVSFASAYHVSCIKFLYEEQVNERMIFEIYKSLSVGLEKSAGVYPYDRYTNFVRHKLMGRSCFKPIMLVLESSEAKKKFTELSHQVVMGNTLWLLILKSSPSEFLAEAKLPFNIELVVAEIRNRDLVEFQEVYRVDDDYPMRIVYFGKWTRLGGLELPSTHLYERRSDLGGKVMRTGSIENWPLSSFKRGVWDGYFPRIWKELERLMNSTTRAIRSNNNSTGSKMSNGSWNGLVGMALKGEIDVIVSEISINAERSSVLSFSRPVLMSKYQIYFTSPGNSLQWDAVFQPFSSRVWIALTAWIAVGTISLAVCYNLSWNYGADANTKKIFSPIESFFFVLQTLCQQGYPETPKSAACRIISLSCFLVSSVLIPSYSAAIISSLTHEVPSRPFDSLEEMLEDGTYKLIVLPNTGQYAHFRNSRDKVHQAVLEKLVKTVPNEYQVRSISEAVDTIFCKLNKYAFFTIEKVFQMKIEYKPVRCPLVSVTRDLAPVYQCMAFLKASPYRDLVDYHLQRMFDVGIINRIEGNIRNIHIHTFHPVFNEVDVDNAFQIFILLMLGFIISVIVLMIEKVHSKGHFGKKLIISKS